MTNPFSDVDDFGTIRYEVLKKKRERAAAARENKLKLLEESENRWLRNSAADIRIRLDELVSSKIERIQRQETELKAIEENKIRLAKQKEEQEIKKRLYKITKNMR